jgi:hypothetical protein
MTANATNASLPGLTDIHDRQLPAEKEVEAFHTFGHQTSYYHRVLRVLKTLPAEHPDKSKYVLEQARLRCGDTNPGRTYLRDLVDPQLAPAVDTAE